MDFFLIFKEKDNYIIQKFNSICNLKTYRSFKDLFKKEERYSLKVHQLVIVNKNNLIKSESI